MVEFSDEECVARQNEHERNDSAEGEPDDEVPVQEGSSEVVRRRCIVAHKSAPALNALDRDPQEERNVQQSGNEED